MSISAAFGKENKQNSNRKTHFEAEDYQRSTMEHSNTVRVGKQKLLESFSVTGILVTTKTNGLLHFEPDPNLVTPGCLPTKGIVEAIANRSFFILVTNNSTKQQRFDKHKVTGLSK